MKVSLVLVAFQRLKHDQARGQGVLPSHLAAEHSARRDTLTSAWQMPNVNVCYRGQTGKHMLASSFSGFDPERTFACQPETRSLVFSHLGFMGIMSPALFSAVQLLS